MARVGLQLAAWRIKSIVPEDRRQRRCENASPGISTISHL
jgi:hypothetical protein